jgi:uncharacterized protein YeaO (DUF488 family)
MAAASSLAWRMLNASMIWEKLRNNAKNPTPKDAERAQALKHLRELARSGTLTLLTATKHAEISEAAVLADLIRG